VHAHMFGNASDFAWASSLRSAGSGESISRDRGTRHSPSGRRSASFTASSHARANPIRTSSSRSPNRSTTAPTDISPGLSASFGPSAIMAVDDGLVVNSSIGSGGGGPGPLNTDVHTPSAIIGDGNSLVDAYMFGNASDFAWASSLRSDGRDKGSRANPSRRRDHSARQGKVPRSDRGYGGQAATRARHQKLSLPHGWTAHTSRSGEAFYHNVATGHTQWHWPTQEPLPHGWEAAVSQSTGAICYHNSATGQTQYEHPVEYAVTAVTAGTDRPIKAETTRGPRRRELQPTKSQPSATTVV
jgi:hypothetical protein